MKLNSAELFTLFAKEADTIESPKELPYKVSCVFAAFKKYNYYLSYNPDPEGKTWTVVHLNWFQRILRNYLRCYSSTHKSTIKNGLQTLNNTTLNIKASENVDKKLVADTVAIVVKRFLGETADISVTVKDAAKETEETHYITFVPESKDPLKQKKYGSDIYAFERNDISKSEEDVIIISLTRREDINGIFHRSDDTSQSSYTLESFLDDPDNEKKHIYQIDPKNHGKIIKHDLIPVLRALSNPRWRNSDWGIYANDKIAGFEHNLYFQFTRTVNGKKQQVFVRLGDDTDNYEFNRIWKDVQLKEKSTAFSVSKQQLALLAPSLGKDSKDRKIYIYPLIGHANKDQDIPQEPEPMISAPNVALYRGARQKQRALRNKQQPTPQNVRDNINNLDHQDSTREEGVEPKVLNEPSISSILPPPTTTPPTTPTLSPVNPDSTEVPPLSSPVDLDSISIGLSGSDTLDSEA